MKCPVDNETLVVSERSNIEIDYCPTCRGVWLDRGELDKIIDRSGEYQQRNAPVSPQQQYDEHQRYDDKRRYDDGKKYKKKRRDSFIGELFDF